jgi:hypothetical protein
MGTRRIAHALTAARRCRPQVATTRQTGDLILVTEDVKRLLNAAPAHVEPRRGVSLKGKREPIALYAPSGTPRRERAEGT